MPKLILHPGDIFCTRGASLFSGLIRIGSTQIGESKTRVNHVGLIVSRGTLRGAQAVEALSSVQQHSLWGKYGPPEKDKVAIFRAKDIFPVEREKIAEKAREYVGKDYGWLKIATHTLDFLLNGAFVFRRLTNSDRYPICSWIVEQAYNEIGWGFGVPLGSTQPDDIWDFCTKSDRFEMIRPLKRLR